MGTWDLSFLQDSGTMFIVGILLGQFAYFIIDAYDGIKEEERRKDRKRKNKRYRKGGENNGKNIKQ